MTQEGVSGSPSKPFSSTLISLLSIIERSNAPETTAEQSEEVVKNLVALKDNSSPSQENALGLKDLTIALRTSFCDYLPASLQAKVMVIQWVASLLKSPSTYKTRTICAVIQELAEVLKFRWLKTENAEHWLPLCISLLELSNACVDALRKQHESALAGFLAGQGWIQLTQIVIGSNANFFKMLHVHPVSKSTAFKSWCKEAFEVQNNYFGFLDTQILPSVALRNACGNTLTMACNLFLASAKEVISELKLLNLTSKAFMRLIPYCFDTSEIRLNLSHVSMSSGSLGYDMPEVVKFIGPLEDVCISTLLEGAENASSDEKFEVIYELCYSGQPTTDKIDGIDPLTPYEWNYGQLHIVLRIMTIFDQLSPDLQLRLFPISKITCLSEPGPGSRFSLISSLVNCIVRLHREEFVPLMDHKAQQPSEDLYLQVLSDITIFSLLVQPEQFLTLRVEMLGLVFHTSEVVSMLAMDWWRCVADRLGQSFTIEQVLLLSEMLGSIPNGVASDKLRRLIQSLCHLLDTSSQGVVIEGVMNKLNDMSANFLCNFPFGSLASQNLEHFADKAMETWRGYFEHLEDLNIVVDVFYAMHPYIASLVSAFSSPQFAGGLHVEVQQSVAAWCVNLLIGCQELISFAQSRPKSIEKIACTVEHVVALLQVLQPLSTADLIQVLSTFVQWIPLANELRPISPCGLAQFLASCGAVEAFDEEEQTKICSLLKALYAPLFEDSRWVVVHQALVSYATLSAGARSPEILQGVIPTAFAESARRYQNHEVLPGHTTGKEERVFWSQLQQSPDGHAPSSIPATATVPTTTLRGLKALSNPVVSKEDCLQGLRVASIYLEGLTQVSPDSLDQGLRAQLMAEMWTLQSLMERLVTPEAKGKDSMVTMDGGN
ncbi:hypothetical protein BGW42_007436 [Actinomortierella wolfii]|nr:hypothetical protein BGW42_007436 [Actinomortierella wolfii]